MDWVIIRKSPFCAPLQGLYFALKFRDTPMCKVGALTTSPLVRQSPCWHDNFRGYIKEETTKDTNTRETSIGFGNISIFLPLLANSWFF